MPVNLTDANFDAEIAKGDVLVDFWATWCAPCRMLAPVIDQLAEKHTDVKVCKVDIDAQPELARRYNVMSIPTVIFFKNGEEKDKSVGLVSLAELEAML